MIVFSAMQGNRKAMIADTFTSDLVSDAIEPIFVSDLVPAICQNEEEEKRDIYRWYIAEYRHGPKHTSVSLLKDLNVGQIVLGEMEPVKIKKKKFLKGKDLEDMLEDY